MIVVADAGPLHYLVLIGAVHVLEPLYGRVLAPEAVVHELQDAKTPPIVRAWIGQVPAWCQIHPDPPADPTLNFLDAGERAAIGLALSIDAERLLIDEQAGRGEAQRRHLLVTGTLGVLADAHRSGLLDFETTLIRLRQTSFYVSATVVERVRRRLFTN